MISDSRTRRLIFEHGETFFIPRHVLVEIKDHILEIIEKSKMPEKGFLILLQFILSKIEIVEYQELASFVEEATKIAERIDPDDMLIIACALARFPCIIWSNDKKLKEQTKIRILNTEEFARFSSKI